MIVLTRGDILQSTAQTLTCPVNTEGVMGKGLAEQFKRRYPKMYEAYKKACRRFYFARHRNFVYSVSEERKVLCLPTKTLWRYPSKIEWIETALRDVAHNYELYGITELAMPPIGCGEGGLVWDDVKRLIYQYLEPLPIKVYLFLPPYDSSL
jgi:O-acetyl-ADP-ribose deacetylase (regulator of RNase III)